MKRIIALILMILTTASLASADTDKGKVLKTEPGNCVGKNTTFKEKHWIDLDNDDKADYAVTIWCNLKVSVEPLGLVSGSWPSSPDSWTAILQYQTVSQNGSYHYAFIYRDKSTNAVIGSEVLDSLDPTSAKVAFYSSLPMVPTVTNRDNQAPVGIISDVNQDVTTFTFEAYEPGLYRVTIHLRREDGEETKREVQMFVNQVGQMTLPCELRKGELAYGFTLHRPNNGSHEASYR